jgi:hypothetical protein
VALSNGSVSDGSGVVDGSSGRRRKSAVANAASAKTKIRFPHPANSSGYGSVRSTRTVTRVVPSRTSRTRSPPPAAGWLSRRGLRQGDVRRSRSRRPESGIAGRARYLDNHAVNLIERDDRAVRRREPQRDGEDAEQHQYDRNNRRCSAGESRTPGAALGRLH